MATPPAKRQRTESGGNTTLPSIGDLISSLTCSGTCNTAVQGLVLPSLDSALPGYLTEARHHDVDSGPVSSSQYAGCTPAQQHVAHSTNRPAPGVPSSVSQPSTDSKTLHRAIRSLTEQEKHDLLYEAAVRHPDIKQVVRAKYKKMIRTQKGKVIDFSSYTRGDWWRLQVDLPDHMRDDPAHDPVNAVNDSFYAIASQVQPESSMGTKRNALEALVDIMLDIWQSDDDQADEMRDRLASDDPDDPFILSLMRCLEAMNAEELAELRAINKDVVEKFYDLDDLVGGDICIQSAIQLLDGHIDDCDEDGSDNTSEDYEKEEREEVVADDDDGGEDED